MKSLPCILILLSLLAVTAVSCEKVKLPAYVEKEYYQDHPETAEDTEGDQTDEEYAFDASWGYNVTYSLENGAMTDTALVNDRAETGMGTAEHPFTVTDITGGIVRAALDESQLSEIKDVWVCGYVVGYINGRTIRNTEFCAGNVATNIVIASSPLVNVYTQCVPVQLSSASSCAAVRSNLNLRDNPDAIGSRVELYGHICKYMGCYGMKNVTDCMYGN